MSEELKPCAFCGGSGILEAETVSAGYGEYQHSDLYHVVKCAYCKASGRRYHQQHLINFTTYTVADFRNNPMLRAKVEDEYEAYCEQTKQLAIESWNRRPQDSEPAALRTENAELKRLLTEAQEAVILSDAALIPLRTELEEAERLLDVLRGELVLTLAAMEQARAEGMEEAAKVCEEDESGRDGGGYFADAIRSAIEKERG